MSPVSPLPLLSGDFAFRETSYTSDNTPQLVLAPDSQRWGVIFSTDPKGNWYLSTSPGSPPDSGMFVGGSQPRWQLQFRDYPLLTQIPWWAVQTDATRTSTLTVVEIYYRPTG